MPYDRDFICFGVPPPERTLEERAWEAELDLIGGYPGLLARTVREHCSGLKGTRGKLRDRARLCDCLVELLHKWTVSSRIAPDAPGYVVSAQLREGQTGVEMEVQIFEGINPVSVTVEMDVHFNRLTKGVEVETKVKGKGYTGRTPP